MNPSVSWRSLTMIALMALATVLLGVKHSPTGNHTLTGDEIRWRQGQRLTWDNFEGRPDRASTADALTESGITFSWTCDARGFRIEAYAIFVPSGSWVKQPTRYLLQHEQLHFDITELHARKLRKYFAEHPNPCNLGKGGIDRAAQVFIQQSYKMQDQYDAETAHGENIKTQKVWSDRIAAELLATEAYAE